MARFNTPPPSRLKGNALATLVRVFVLAAFLVTAVQSPAFAEWKDLQVFNYTGYPISELYISTTGEDKWGKNLLAKTLKHGESATISYNNTFRYWDLKIVFIDGAGKSWKGEWMRDNSQDFKNAWRITFYNSGRVSSDGKLIFTVSMN